MNGGAAATVTSGILLALQAAALWGAGDFLGGVATRRAPAMLVVTIAHGLSFFLVLSFALAARSPLPPEHAVLWGIAAGLTGSASLILFYRALAIGEMGLAAALTGVLTAIVPVTFSFLSEGFPKAAQLAGFALAAAAIWLIAHSPGGASHPRGLGLAAISGLGFGVFYLASKFAAQGGGILWTITFTRLAGASLAAISLLAAAAFGAEHSTGLRARFTVRSVLTRRIVAIAAAAGFLDTAGNVMYMLATRVGRLDVAAVLGSLYPVGTILLAIVFLKERATPRQSVGMALALGAVVLISL